MTSATRQELLRVLSELSAECPDVRMGQLINLDAGQGSQRGGDLGCRR